MKRLLVLIGALTVCWVLVGCHDDSAESKPVVRPVKSMTIKAVQATTARNFPGKVVASKKAIMSFLVPGQLVVFPIREGMAIKKGQVLGELDAKKYVNRVKELEAKFIRSRAEFQRAAQLIKDYHISRTEYDNKKSAYLVAEANLSTAHRDLRDTKLFAPFDGVIAKKYVENFEFIKAKQPIVKVQDITQIDIEINVPENIMIHLRDEPDGEQPVAIFDALPGKRYPVKFKELQAEADPETLTYRVTMTMPAPKAFNILPGMTVTIHALLPDAHGLSGEVFLVPAAAVYVNPRGQSAVWVIDMKTMRVKERVVQVSRMSQYQIRVTSGLSAGERIVTAGAHFLKEGEKVRLIDSKNQAPSS